MKYKKLLLTLTLPSAPLEYILSLKNCTHVMSPLCLSFSDDNLSILPDIITKLNCFKSIRHNNTASLT